MSKFSIDIENNVRVIVYDGKRHVKQIVEKHNKATRNLVLGLIKFLRGEFNSSNISISSLSHNEENAKAFIPAYISFGDGSLLQLGSPKSGGGIVTNIDEVMSDIQNLSETSFANTKLDRELVGNKIGNESISDKGSVGRLQITRTSYSNDITDSITLKLSAVVDQGFYSKNFYLDPTYKNARGTNLPIYLSELGLYSSDFSGSSSEYSGNLLARVVFNDKENNPLIEQTDEDIILVDWTIQITSIDEWFSENNTTNIVWNGTPNQ